MIRECTLIPLLLLLASTTSAFTTTSSPRSTVVPPASSTRLASRVDESLDLSNDVVVPTTTDEERAFLSRTAALCAERNIPFERIKNARDLASVRNSPVSPNRVYRVGRVSDASSSDLDALFGEIGIKTLVDLRSPTELRDDPSLDRADVFGNFTDMVFYERGRMVKELRHDEYRMTKRRKRDVVLRAVGGAVNGTKDVLLGFVDNFFGNDEDEEGGRGEGGIDEDDDDDDDDCIDCIEAGRLIEEQRTRKDRKERHFVSIMNELKYVRGTMSKLRKRDIAKTIIKSPTTIISKTARENIKKPFLDEINGGGLPMLNELLLRFGAPGIKYVLDLCSDVNRHPVAFYCTAGKDRTGMIAAIILALLGADDADIVEDYSLSANVYAEMADHKAMVGALSQRSLDAKTFLGAPPSVMEDTLRNIRRDYGGVEEYLDFIGFGKDSRDRLIRALTQ